jgi:hypothetical protein
MALREQMCEVWTVDKITEPNRNKYVKQIRIMECSTNVIKGILTVVLFTCFTDSHSGFYIV